MGSLYSVDGTTGNITTIGYSKSNVVSPTNWQSTGALNHARWNFGCVRLSNGKILVAGGWTSGFSGTSVTATCEIYDPLTQVWTLTGSLSTGRAAPTLVVLQNGKVLAFGGSFPGGSFSADAEIYDPTAGTWSITGSLNTARGITPAWLLTNGKVLTAGGFNGSALATSEIYDPVATTWSFTGSLNTARYDVGYVLLPNGKALTVGGFGNIATAEVYDPVATTWSFTSNNPSAACGNDSINNLVVLPSGKTLRIGGLFNGGSTTPDVDLYDYVANTFSPAASLNTSRAAMAVYSLPSGNVVVAGGYTTEPNAISSVEIYDPVANTWVVGPSLPFNRTYTGADVHPLYDNNLLLMGGFDGTNPTSTTVLLSVFPLSNVTSIHADSNSNLTGNVQLVSGTNITLSQVGQAITVNASSAGVSSITGTTHQIIASASTGAVTLSTPQNIDTSSSPTFVSETLTATTNQLVLGTTHTTTINSTAPSVSRTYTIPDAGANANVVLDHGAYTIAGQLTLSLPLILPDTINSSASGTISPTANFKNYIYTLAGSITIDGPSSPLYDGQEVVFRIRQAASGGPFTVTFASGSGNFSFGTTFSSYTMTATASATDFIGAIWNAANNVWNLVSISQGF